MQRIFLVCVLLFGLVACSFAVETTLLSFRKDWEMNYSVKSSLDSKGMGTDGKRTSGSTATLTATMTIRCIEVNSNSSAKFTMRVKDAVLSDGTTTSNYLVTDQRERGNSVDTHLGDPVVFVQKNTGEVISVSFTWTDKTYYKNLKLGLINSLHTKIVPVGSSVQYQDRDVVGDHSSQVSCEPSTSSSNLKKEFDQKGFNAFPDPALKPHNIKLQAQTSTQVHKQGFIQSSTVNQVVAMVNINDKASNVAYNKLNMKNILEASTKRGMFVNPEPIDLLLSSYGSLAITGAAPQFVAAVEMDSDAEFEEGFTGDLFEAAAHVQGLLFEEQMNSIDIENTLETIFDKTEEALTKENAVETVRLLDLAVRWMNYKIEDIDLLTPVLEAIQSEYNELAEPAAGLAFYILSGVNSEQSSDLFIDYGIKSENPLVQKAALVAIHNSGFDSEDVIQALAGIYENSESEDFKSFALLALGSVASRSASPQSAKDILVREAKEAVEAQEGRAIDSIFAIGNAGSSVFSSEEVLNLNFQSHPSDRVQEKLIKVLQNSFGLDYAPSDDYPFYKSKQVSYTLGGKTVGATFQAEGFIGTNFNCNQTQFNYKLSADASVTVLLFERSEEAVSVDAVYGQVGGNLLDNAAHLKVFGKIVKSATFPGLGDCQSKSYPIGQISPGFSVQYTVFVSVVPITFSASASLKLQLSWGWQVCPRDLSAQVDITPEAELIFRGDALIDLMIIKAGTGIQGSLDAALVPRAYVHGTQCSVGLDLTLVQQPLAIKFSSYIQWKKCKLLIFNCKWGDQKEIVWFDWQRPAQTKTLWNQEYKIIKGL